jgi:two-component system sensor histidine kinase QseC
VRRLHSIQARLLALIAGLLVTVWSAAAALTWIDVRHELDELLDAHLAQAAALLIAQQAQEVDEERDVDAPALHRYAPRVAFQVFRRDRLALRSANAPLVPMVGDAPDLAAGFQTVQLNGRPWRVFVANGEDHDMRVLVGEQMASRAEILWAVMRGSLGPLLLALPLLLLGAWWSVARGLVPLRVLVRELRRRAPQALQPLQMNGTPAEIAPVVQELNRLLDRVGHLMELERRFTADAAHELRTPIAAIRAQAQVALNEGDDAARGHALRATLAGCDRAARLVDQLLTLSRLEADEARHRETVDLAALLRAVVAEIAPRALAKAQVLEVDGAPALTVSSDAVLLSVLVRNLVDNAVRYSPAGARVQVRLGRSEGRVWLRVDDSGPGLADESLKRLGERFFRGGTGSESGSGLGWSIVRRIAQVLGCEVEVQRSALGGLGVRVTMMAEGGRFDPLLEEAE